ncbi:MAG: alpha-galactosidase [Armatimonadetes bacterium]|nr:alpha-galactosidase [Armatimonadota bacterium]
MIPFLLLAATHSPQHNIDVRTEQVSVSVSRATGRFDLAWNGNRAAIRSAYGEVKLSDGTTYRTDEATTHTVDVVSIQDRFGKGRRLVIHHRKDGKPELRQTISVYGHEVFVSLDIVGKSEQRSNYIAALVAASATMPHTAPLQCLFTPYDNDNYAKYRSDGWKDVEPEGSYEVGGIYDDSTRKGLIVGSIDHDVWKSAIQFDRAGRLTVFAGATGKFTHDRDPHGEVAGKTIHSPRFVVSPTDDWRAGLERYGDLNAMVQPKLPWKGPVPMGWNSWSGHKDKVTYNDAVSALNFVHTELPWLRTGDTAYINFDSFWDNLTREQRVDFVKKCHAAGLKAGIYWTPFVNWGEPDWKAIDGYKFKDLQLKDAKGELLPKLDGGWPLDPTHPGTLARIDANMKDFVDQGFDYIKLDFLTHGSLEGKHYDPKVTTGTAAYRVGMQHLVDQVKQSKIGRPFFISLSIAPLFPQGYGHSRRISCDVFSNIGASEYFLNSQNYAWWQAGRLYAFDDPDSACVYQARGEEPTLIEEARTRFTASVIGGGMMIEGDNLTDPAAIARVRTIFGNKEAIRLAAKTPQFRPVYGNMGEGSGDHFVWIESPNSAYIALFNFDRKNPATKTIDFARCGLGTGKWNLHDLWTGKDTVASGKLDLELASRDCALIHLTRRP